MKARCWGGVRCSCEGNAEFHGPLFSIFLIPEKEREREKGKNCSAICGCVSLQLVMMTPFKNRSFKPARPLAS